MITSTEFNQTTISAPVTLSGVGLHTGKTVDLVFQPAPAGFGYAFKRTDLEGQPVVEALANYVTETQRGTTLDKNGVRINTCEHVLAALVGLEIDNCLIEINSSEPPIMDGSSQFFIQALEQVGTIELDAKRVEYVVKEVFTHRDENGSEIMLIPADKYEVVTMVDFGTKVLGTQNAQLNNIADFKTEIANARTFSFLHEIEMLLDHGLIQGGDLNNAIVYVDKELSEKTMTSLKKAFNKENISVKPNGILDNLTLHYPNEAARHKLLDVVGDLSLIGTRIRGRVIATKPGHGINTQFAKIVEKQIKVDSRNLFPSEIDFNAEPLMDVNRIMEMLPHRSPFLLVDKIFDITDSRVVGLKNVTMNEPYFVGHFPSEPVMPGVLIVEAMAQTGGILVLSTVPDPENYLTYFMKIDNVKFKRKVVPGDTLIFRCDLITPFRRGICHMKAFAYANGIVCAEAELMAQISKVK